MSSQQSSTKKKSGGGGGSKSGGGGGGGGGNQETMNQDKLVAIVLLDTYSNKFEPFSSSCAECLLPVIGGKTLLDMNLEFLINNQVEEIYLFCTRHSAQIKAYLEKSNWRKRASPVEIHFSYNLSCRSLGDAMREIDAKGQVRSTFILMTATGVVSNLSLADNLEHHRVVSKKDRNVVMTMLCTPKLGEFATSSKNKNFHTDTIIVHNANQKILEYNQGSRRAGARMIMSSSILDQGYSSIKQAIQQQLSVESANARFNLADNNTAVTGYQGGNAQTITHLASIQMRSDLLESHIYLCNAHVLHMFTDSFDYQSMPDFVNGVLSDEEVSGSVIHMDTMKPRFGSHFSLIADLNTYYVEMMRVLARADLTLDYELFKRQPDRINVYVNKQALKVGNNCRLERNVFVDAGCRIGEKCELENCLIAANCHIGANTKLSNSIVWPNSRIGPNCVINACLIGFNVRVGANVKICENCILGNEVQVKNDTVLSQRGAYVKKDALAETSKNDVPDSANMEVKEDNYTKLILSKRFKSDDGGADDSDDDDFDDDDDDNDQDDDDDDENNDSEDSEASRDSHYDTTKNRHFVVWRTRSSVRKSVSHDSGSELSDESEDSDDERGPTTRGADEYDDDDNDGVDGGGGDGHSDEGGDHHNEEDAELFLSEVQELLQEAIKTNMDPSNLILEINGRKHANNIQIDDLNYYLAKALFRQPIASIPRAQLASFNYLNAFKDQIKKQTELFENYYTRTKKSQLEFLNSHLEFFVELNGKVASTMSTTTPNHFIDTYYVKTLHYLFNEYDFLSQEAINEWYEKQISRLATSNETTKYAIGKLKPFIEWLNEDEDDDDDE